MDGKVGKKYNCIFEIFLRGSKFSAVTITVFTTILEQNR
jgi:hypothetical protein